MNIPINKNIDEYRDDFFKGLSMRQCIYSVTTLVTGGGAFFVSSTVLGLPQMISIYITMLFAIPIAAAGFVKIHGMSLPEYLRKKKETEEMPGFFYESEESIFIIESNASEPYGKGKDMLHALIEMIKRRIFQKAMLEVPKSVEIEEAERWLNN